MHARKFEQYAKPPMQAVILNNNMPNLGVSSHMQTDLRCKWVLATGTLEPSAMSTACVAVHSGGLLLLCSKHAGFEASKCGLHVQCKRCRGRTRTL